MEVSMNRIIVSRSRFSGFVTARVITDTHSGRRSEPCTLRTTDVAAFAAQQATHRPVLVQRDDLGGIVKVQPASVKDETPPVGD
jgi:hypothetical protein